VYCLVNKGQTSVKSKDVFNKDKMFLSIQKSRLKLKEIQETHKKAKLESIKKQRELSKDSTFVLSVT
jgi:hypothetical protein